MIHLITIALIKKTSEYQFSNLFSSIQIFNQFFVWKKTQQKENLKKKVIRSWNRDITINGKEVWCN